tara:strand:- start:1770 stop:2276 length:507 start_codon:yes stop_codon:yes gene_type:complete
MSNKENIIKKINDNFIKKQKEIKKIVNLDHNYETRVSVKNYDVLDFRKDDKFQFSTKFNYYGILDNNNIFHWANTFQGVDVRFMEQIEKIKSYSNIFDKSNDPDHLFYYQVLTSDKFTMDINEQFKFIKLLMYLDKSFYFIEPMINDNNKAIITLKEHKNQKFFEKKI